MRSRLRGSSVIGIVSVVLMTGATGGCDGGGSEVGPPDGAGPAPRVLITVSNGRQVEVNGRVFGDGRHSARPAKGAPPGRTVMVVGAPGKVTPVSIASGAEDSLTAIHIDASAEAGTILLYGAYGGGMAALSLAGIAGRPSAASARAGWECIWCGNEVLACGVNPQCGN